MNTYWNLVFALFTCVAIEAQAGSRDYAYDPFGNRLSATNQIRFTAAEGFLIEPRRAFSGGRVNILGRNFPAGQNSAVTVSVGGTVAQVLFVSERVITILVPTIITGGQVTLSIQGSAPATVGVIAMQGVNVTPSVVELDYAGQQQFTATVFGGTSQAVTWTVTDLRGRTTRVGSVTAAGLYTAISSAGSGSDPDFPFLVRATSDEIRVSGYALVKLASNNRGPISNRAMGSGTLVAAERHGWQFTGQALQHAYIACLSSSPIADLVLRDANGIAVARSGPGSRLKLADVELRESGQYRIEVHGAASPSGSYQIWLNQHAPFPTGIWMFPGDGAWEDGGNWSRGQLPTARDAVAMDFPSADLTITLGSGTHACSSVRSQEKLTLAGGVLTITGEIQVDNTWRMSGGTLAEAKVQPGVAGQMPMFGGYPSNLFDRVNVNGDLVMSELNARLRVAGGLRVNGTVYLRGGAATLSFVGTQSIAAGTIIVAEGTDESARRIDAAGTDEVTLEAGAVIRGSRLVIGGGSGALKLTNHGRISATSAPQNFELACASFVNAAGGTLESVSGVLRVRAQSWTNAGRIVGQNGVIHLGESDQQQVWSNIGTIQMSGGVLSLGGRVTSTGIGLAGLSVNGGATISVVGLIENQGRVLRLTGPSGTWLLQGGTLRGGDLDTRSSSLTVDSYRTNLLDDVTVQGDLLMPNRFSMIKVAGGLRVNGRVLMSGINAWLGFDGSQDIAAGTTIVASGSPTFISAAVNSDITVTVQDGALIQGQSLIVFDGDAWAWPHRTLTFVNQGTMSVAAGGRIALDSAVAINEGSLEVLAGGTLALAQILTQRTPTAELRLIGGTVAAAATVDIQGGVTTGYGSITVLQPSLFRNGGILRPGGLGQPGRLSVQGDFVQVLGGRIEVELGGLIAGTEFDQLAVSGTAALTGVIRATLLGSFSPARTNAFDVLSCQSSIGDFAVYDLPPLGGGLSWTHGFSGTAPQRLVLVVQ